MAERVAPLRPSEHLLALVERAGVAAGRLAGADPDARRAARAAAVRAQARSSARLDASPLTEETADRVDGSRGGPTGAHEDRAEIPADPAGEGPAHPPGEVTAGWASALRLDRLPTQELAAREYDNLLAAAAVEDELVDSVLDAPLSAMNRLHQALCAGLVADDVIGTLRRTPRAVHDGAQGRMLWACPAPERLPELLEGLLEWLGGPAATRSAVVVAAVVHERLLQWQPFEAANGRLARAMARLLRRARELDPDGLAVPEVLWSADALAYHREVAATIRRRDDLTRWAERCVHGEALALERAADALRTGELPSAPERVLAYLDGVGPGTTITPREYAARVGTTPLRARADLDRARRAGLVDDDLTAMGLRYVTLS